MKGGRVLKTMKTMKIMIFEKSDILRTKMANVLSSLNKIGMTMITSDFDMVVNGTGGCAPDILIMDIGLAQSYKKELAALKADNPGIKLMLHSEMVDEEFNGCARSLGADVFFDFMELVKEVSKSLKVKAR